MSQMIDFTVPSTVPGRSLHAFRCVPDGEVKAILQLSHGTPGSTVPITSATAARP